MKRLLIAIVAAMCLAGCNDDNSFAKLPEKISEFLSEYWPNSGYSSYQQDDGNYIITIKDGPRVTFSGSMAWTSVDGLGATLPQQFLYDQLPERLYDYIESAEATGEVFRVERNDKQYIVGLLESTLTYVISTEGIREDF